MKKWQRNRRGDDGGEVKMLDMGGISLVVQCLRLCTSTAGVWSLVGELRSRKLRSLAKRKRHWPWEPLSLLRAEGQSCAKSPATWGGSFFLLKKFIIIFLLKDNYSTILRGFLPNINVNQAQVYRCPLHPEGPLPPPWGGSWRRGRWHPADRTEEEARWWAE